MPGPDADGWRPEKLETVAPPLAYCRPDTRRGRPCPTKESIEHEQRDPSEAVGDGVCRPRRPRGAGLRERSPRGGPDDHGLRLPRPSARRPRPSPRRPRPSGRWLRPGLSLRSGRRLRSRRRLRPRRSACTGRSPRSGRRPGHELRPGRWLRRDAPSPGPWDGPCARRRARRACSRARRHDPRACSRACSRARSRHDACARSGAPSPLSDGARRGRRAGAPRPALP